MRRNAESKITKSERCINPDCRSRGKMQNAKVRGLCENCYRAILRLIKTGKITMQEAEERGIVRKPQPPGSGRFPIVAGATIVQPTTRKVRPLPGSNE
jgi:hypothetical protein